MGQPSHFPCSPTMSSLPVGTVCINRNEHGGASRLFSFSGWHLGSSSPLGIKPAPPLQWKHRVLNTALPEKSLQRLLRSNAQGTDMDKLGDSCSPDLLASHQTVTNKNIMDSIWLPLMDFLLLKKRSRCFTQQERIPKVCRWNEICIAALKGHLYGNIHTVTFHQIYVKYLFYLFIWLYWVLVVACGLWFPDQGSNPGPWHWERQVLTTRPPGKPLQPALKANFPFADTSGMLLGGGYILSMILLKFLVHYIMKDIILHFLLFTSSIFFYFEG